MANERGFAPIREIPWNERPLKIFTEYNERKDEPPWLELESETGVEVTSPEIRYDWAYQVHIFDDEATAEAMGEVFSSLLKTMGMNVFAPNDQIRDEHGAKVFKGLAAMASNEGRPGEAGRFLKIANEFAEAPDIDGQTIVVNVTMDRGVKIEGQPAWVVTVAAYEHPLADGKIRLFDWRRLEYLSRSRHVLAYAAGVVKAGKDEFLDRPVIKVPSNGHWAIYPFIRRRKKSWQTELHEPLNGSLFRIEEELAPPDCRRVQLVEQKICFEDPNEADDGGEEQVD